MPLSLSLPLPSEWCTASVGSAGIAAIAYENGHHILTRAAHTTHYFWLLGLVVDLLLALATAIPCILCNVLIFATVPVLAEKLERQRTFAGKEVSIALKLAFFQVYNTILASLAFLLDPTLKVRATLGPHALTSPRTRSPDPGHAHQS